MEGEAAIAAALLATTAVWITDPERVFDLLFGVAVVGVGVAVLRGGQLLAGVTGVGVGVAVVGVGVAVVGVGVTVAWRTGLPARAWGWLTADPAEPVESPPGAAHDPVDDAATPDPPRGIPPPGST